MSKLQDAGCTVLGWVEIELSNHKYKVSIVSS